MQGDNNAAEKRERTLGLLVVFALVAFALSALPFVRNFRNAFISYDDYDYIILNEGIADGLSPRSIEWSLVTMGYAGNWHPLAWMSHAFDYTLARNLNWDVAPENILSECQFTRLVHAENILLHGLNAALLWTLMVLMVRKMKPEAPGDELPSYSPYLALLFALLWAVHPLRVEVVAWAAERKELLSVFFMLLTLILYVTEKQGAAIVTFILALMAKPVAVTLPAVILAYDLIFERRSLSEAVRGVLPYAGLSALVCLLTMKSQGIALEEGAKWGWDTKIICAVQAPVTYLFQTIWPFELSMDYVVPDWGSWPVFALGVILILALLAVSLKWSVGFFRQIRPTSNAAKSQPSFLDLAAFAIAWCYVGLLPMIGIVKVGYEPHSDRYTYWIGCGLALTVVLLLEKTRSAWTKYRKPAMVLLALTIICFSALSFHQSRLWKNTINLFSYVVDHHLHERFAQPLGVELIRRDGKDGAIKAERILRETLAARETPRAHAALAIHLAYYGVYGGAPANYAEARRLAQEAMPGDSSNGCVYAALAFADRHDGDFKSAYSNMKKALDLHFKSPFEPLELKDWQDAAEKAAKGATDVQR